MVLRRLVALASLGLVSGVVETGCGGKTVALGSHGESIEAGASGKSGAGGAGGFGGGMPSGGAAGSGGSIGGGAGSSVAGSAGKGQGTLRFLDMSPVEAVNTESLDDNPTLTADGLEIFFTSDRDGDMDVWVATRADLTVPFGQPELVAEANTADEESSPAISPDGLTLWVGQQDQSGGLGGYDIWALSRSRRSAPWSGLLNAAELNSAEDDIPRPTALRNTVMPLGSRRDLVGYRTYLATRATPDDPFGAPVILDELSVPGESVVDGFLTEDGLMIFYSRTATENAGDLFYATRPDLDSPFGTVTPITELNSDADERDPWLSPDGTELYFASDVQGNRDIYRALVSRE